MFISPVLIVRIVQGVIAFIAMALGATVANVLNTHTPSIEVSPAVVFFLFVAVFTLLVAVPYTILAPRYFPALAHPAAMLTAETITAIFWLSGFASMADRLGRSDICKDGACSSATGTVVVGVFEFILFGITAFFAFSHMFLGGRYGGSKPENKAVCVHRSWTGAERV